MAFERLRRVLFAALALPALMLAGCGGSTVESQLRPTRLVVFGDATADVGQTGVRYTINDGTTNVWVAQLAARYGLSIAPAASGGTGYAQGNARAIATTDAAGGTAPSVRAQIDAFLGAGGRFTDTDLVVVSAGTSDVVAVARGSGAVADIDQAARDLADEVRRLLAAGASHVVLVTAYDLGKSPWAISTNRVATLSGLSTAFAIKLKATLADVTTGLFYVDAAEYFNLVTFNPAAYLGTVANGTAAACNTAGTGAQIGVEASQAASPTCTAGTLVSGATATNHVFADALYPTPVMHRLFGDYAYTRILTRW